MIHNLWNSINGLTKLSEILQWASWSLVILGVFFGIAKLYVDKQQKHLTAISLYVKESDRHKQEIKFEETIRFLESELSERKQDIVELEKKTVPVNPYLQFIRTGTASVEVVIKSNEEVNSHFIDRGGYIAFCKGNNALVVLAADSCYGNRIGNGEVRYRGVFELDATSEATTKSIFYLKDSEYIQIGFLPMLEEVEVLRGKAICTFNNTVRVEFDVPAQKAKRDQIINRNIRAAFEDFKE